MTTRIVIVGGFLGAGKTTLLLRAARTLTERGYRVGLITNDQGDSLVDTALGEAASVPVVEVAGGCFCCRFPDLMAGLEHLRETVDPQIILAEPVGSCTDLVATVLRPLVQFYPEQYELAPLTVLLDSTATVGEFPASVQYLFGQQLAEAELIVLSKSDLLAAEAVEQQAARQAESPQARVMAISAQTGVGVDGWLDVVLGQASANPEALQIDYAAYAEAEAALGWLNARGRVRADDAYSARRWTSSLLTEIAERCAAQQAPIAHVKVLVTAAQVRLKASLTQASAAIHWDLDEATTETAGHEFILNARVHATPSQLEQIALQAIEAARPGRGSRYYIEQFECFSPLPPQPTHRLG